MNNEQLKNIIKKDIVKLSVRDDGCIIYYKNIIGKLDLITYQEIISICNKDLEIRTLVNKLVLSEIEKLDNWHSFLKKTNTEIDGYDFYYNSLIELKNELNNDAKLIMELFNEN